LAAAARARRGPRSRSSAMSARRLQSVGILDVRDLETRVWAKGDLGGRRYARRIMEGKEGLAEWQSNVSRKSPDEGEEKRPVGGLRRKRGQGLLTQAGSGGSARSKALLFRDRQSPSSRWFVGSCGPKARATRATMQRRRKKDGAPV